MLLSKIIGNVIIHVNNCVQIVCDTLEHTDTAHIPTHEKNGNRNGFFSFGCVAYILPGQPNVCVCVWCTHIYKAADCLTEIIAINLIFAITV